MPVESKLCYPIQFVKILAILLPQSGSQLFSIFLSNSWIVNSTPVKYKENSRKLLKVRYSVIVLESLNSVLI